MKKYITVILFFACNIIGVFAVLLSYTIAQLYIIDIETSNFSITNMQKDIGIILIMWAVCAMFSFASFFLSFKWKVFFLSAPIIIPLISSLVLLSTYT